MSNTVIEDIEAAKGVEGRVLRQRVEEAGVGHVMFVAYQALALAHNTLLGAFSAVLTRIAMLTREGGLGILDLLSLVISSFGNALAIVYGFRLIYLKHTSTRRFWAIYLVVSILVYVYYLLRGAPGCFSTIPMVCNLACLVYWTSSKRVEALYP